jgi:hypothetical protein
MYRSQLVTNLRLVLHEDVKPIPRLMLYFKPRTDNQWVLFFNETVTFASHQEVFENTFRRTTGPNEKSVPLKSPVMLIYMKVSMVDDLLG